MRILLVVVLVLGACAGPSSKPKAERAQKRAEAASIQAQLARGYMDKGNIQVALANITRALEFDPNSVEALTVAAVIHERIGRTEQAEEYFRRAVELEPENGDLINNYGTILHKQGRYDEAIRHFERALQQPFYRTPSAALSNAGASAERQKRLDVAEDYYRRALTHDKTNPDALFRMAKLMFNSGQHLKARGFLQRLEVGTQSLPEMLLLGYQIECAMGDTDTARTYAKSLRGRFPDSEQSRTLEQTDGGELCHATNEKLRAASR